MTGELLNTGYAALSEEDDKFIARGMALGAGDVTQGGSGKKTYWPPDVVEEAAEDLAGQPFATSQDHTADGPQTQTPPEAIAGEVQWSGFGEVDGKAGVLYETEVDDPDIARNIENGRIEVSPLVFREAVPVDEYDGDAPDDVDVVATEIKKWRDLAAVRNGASPSNHIEPGSAAAMSAEALHDAVASMQGESNPNEPAESGAEDGPSDDGEDGGNPSSSAANDDDSNMTENELTREEEAVLSAAESLESPVEALEAYEAAEQPSIVDEEEHEVVPSDEYESLQEQVSEVESIMSEALAERTDLKESTIEALSFEALCDEFRDEDGNLEVEALVQEPETEEPEPTDEPEDEGAEALEEDPEIIKQRYTALKGAGMTEQAESLAEEFEEATGERL